MQPLMTRVSRRVSRHPFVPALVCLGAALLSVLVASGYSLREYHWYQEQGVQTPPVSPLVPALFVAAIVFGLLAVVFFALGLRIYARHDDEDVVGG